MAQYIEMMCRGCDARKTMVTTTGQRKHIASFQSRPNFIEEDCVVT